VRPLGSAPPRAAPLLFPPPPPGSRCVRARHCPTWSSTWLPSKSGPGKWLTSASSPALSSAPSCLSFTDTTPSFSGACAQWLPRCTCCERPSSSAPTCLRRSRVTTPLVFFSLERAPASDFKQRCLPANFSDDTLDIFKNALSLVFKAGFTYDQGRFMCGDTIFSGHAMVFTLVCLFVGWGRVEWRSTGVRITWDVQELRASAIAVGRHGPGAGDGGAGCRLRGCVASALLGRRGSGRAGHLRRLPRSRALDAAAPGPPLFLAASTSPPVRRAPLASLALREPLLTGLYSGFSWRWSDTRRPVRCPPSWPGRAPGPSAARAPSSAGTSARLTPAPASSNWAPPPARGRPSTCDAEPSKCSRWSASHAQ